MADTHDENEAEQCASRNEGGRQAIRNSTAAKQYTVQRKKSAKRQERAQAQSQVPLQKK